MSVSFIVSAFLMGHKRWASVKRKVCYIKQVIEGISVIIGNEYTQNFYFSKRSA